MARITIEQIEESYKLGCKVYSNKLSIDDAKLILVNDLGMNKSSAGMYISSVGNLLSGFMYKRTINIEATSYFLSNIEKDFGNKKLKSALLAIDAHIIYYEKKSNSKVRKLRTLIDGYWQKLESLPKKEELEIEFEQEVQESSNRTSEERLDRMKHSEKTPSSSYALTKVYNRNPDTKAEVLFQAKGICEFCKKKAPFITSKNSRPFLEHHHIKPLSEGGEDTIENSMALCPNCHREAHYGENWRKFRR